MEHLSDNQLLDLLNPQGPPAGPQADHLAGCEDCRRRLADLRQTWDVLGQWSVEDREVDLTARIMSQAQPARTIRLWQPRALVRVAAAIALGVALGSLAGRPGAPAISHEQVSEAMYLDVLALQSPTGWTSPLLEETGSN